MGFDTQKEGGFRTLDRLFVFERDGIITSNPPCCYPYLLFFLSVDFSVTPLPCDWEIPNYDWKPPQRDRDTHKSPLSLSSCVAVFPVRTTVVLFFSLSLFRFPATHSILFSLLPLGRGDSLLSRFGNDRSSAKVGTEGGEGGAETGLRVMDQSNTADLEVWVGRLFTSARQS